MYAHGIEISDITLPKGWRERLIDITIDDEYYNEKYTAWCLSLPDLCVSKLAAGRPKDFVVVEWLLKNKHITTNEIAEVIEQIPEHQKKQKIRAIANLTLARNRALSNN